MQIPIVKSCFHLKEVPVLVWVFKEMLQEAQGMFL